MCGSHRAAQSHCRCRRLPVFRRSCSRAVPPAAECTRCPPAPQTDYAVRRKQDNDEENEADESLEAASVDPDCDQCIKREGAQDHIDDGTDKRTDRMPKTADDGDDEKVDGRLDAGGAWRNLIVEPHHQNSAD